MVELGGPKHTQEAAKPTQTTPGGAGTGLSGELSEAKGAEQPSVPPPPVQTAGDDLPCGGGFILDRPANLVKFMEALDARLKVAIGKNPDLDLENNKFSGVTLGIMDDSKKAEIEKLIQEGRIIAYASPGHNEGYYVDVLVAPAYLDRGPAIPVTSVKCWSRNAAQAVLREVSELTLRW